MVTVRKCRSEDEGIWVELNREFMAYEYEDENVWESPLEKGDPAEIFRAVLSEPESANLLLMIENDGQPIGFMNTVIFYSIWAHGKVLFLDDFFIREPFRGRGCGRAALTELEAMMRTWGCLRIQLLAEDTNPGAVAFYLHSDTFHAVNRLDRGTTGVMAVAKTGFVHARCMAQLHTPDFQRDYRAVCEGVPQPLEGDIDLPLSRAEGSLLKRRPDPAGQSAHTHYQVLETAQGRALLRLRPLTGRTHQLRLHMAAMGHPLTGDWLYGTEDPDLIPRPALHSCALRLRHPVTGELLTLTAPLPEDIQRLLA